MTIFKSIELTRSFGSPRAVDCVSIDFAKGELTAIIGPNGAGKSTYFNLMSGRIKPSSGAVFYMEENVTGLPPYEMMRKGVGRSFQITNIFRGLTAFENMRIGTLAYKKRGGNIFSQVEKMKPINEQAMQGLEVVGLEEKKDTIAGALSYGDQRRLEIGLTLTCNPSLMLLDEPTAGMNPEETKMLTKFIRTISEDKGITVIFTEHDMSVVFDISERIIVMQQGHIIADGKESDIRSDENVKVAYLGVET
jgi:branched-chain amino acid transport system ATP-binding protein